MTAPRSSAVLNHKHLSCITMEMNCACGVSTVFWVFWMVGACLCHQRSVHSSVNELGLWGCHRLLHDLRLWEQRLLLFGDLRVSLAALEMKWACTCVTLTSKSVTRALLFLFGFRLLDNNNGRANNLVQELHLFSARPALQNL